MAAPSKPLWLDVYDTPYSNGSNYAANVLFLIIVCGCLTSCIAAAWKTRRCIIFSIALCIAYILEIIAYALRLQSWYIVSYTTNFGLSLIAPVFVTIAIHLCTAHVLTALGTEHAVLSPNAHLRVFIWTDLFAGLLQAIGLGLTFSAAKAAGQWGITLPSQAGSGQAVTYAGLLIQTLALAAALSLLAVAYIRAGRADRRYEYTAFQRNRAGYVPRLSPRFKTLLVVLPLAGVCTLVRCAYRCAATWGGLGSSIARDEVLWLVAEGVFLTEAMLSLAVFHPAIWLDGETGKAGGWGSHGGGGGIPDVEHGGGISTSKEDKRLTVGTFMTAETDGLPYSLRDSRQDLEEIAPVDGRRVLFSTNLITPSDVSSSPGGSAAGADSRRGSSIADEHEHEHEHERERLYQTDPYPYNNFSQPHRDATMRTTTTTSSRYSQDITSESRGLSPLEAEAELERQEAESFIQPPRKSSKRMSRILEQQRRELEEMEEAARREIDSIVLPSRKPSRRDTVRTGGGGVAEDEALTSNYSQSLYSQ
ncbi:hypothetical protein VPNG_01840 [Cytospora leucostoma]|uniref:Sphingoid long-chain base transporter RSB1 n=1 Tax=Cytospora leucostoma TaxID=1230097 RepID=A0A423XIJ0_9PEZI|nr:hypothetical protein VPNG_01840 [Cytospora leucostoma]